MRWWWKYTKYDPYEVIIGKMGRNIGGKKKKIMVIFVQI